MSVHQRIAIPTLSGGVGRQASNKRLTSEAENLDNCLVTLEKSVEKRPPLEFFKGSDSFYSEETSATDDFPAPGSLLFNTLSTGQYQPTTEDDIFFKWISIDSDDRFLIAINFSLKLENSSTITDDERKKFITVWRLNPDNKRMDLQTFDFDSITVDHYNYITKNPNARSAADTFDFALFGSAIILLNKQVSARFRDDIARDIDNNKNVLLDLTSATIINNRLRVKSEDNEFIKLELVDLNETAAKDLTFKGFNNFFKFGLEPNICEITMTTDDANNASVCSFFVQNFKEPNGRFEFLFEDIKLISGALPAANDTRKFIFTLKVYGQDPKGKKINYRTATLPTTTGKNLVPVLETTKLSELDVDPVIKLFGNDGATRVANAPIHTINNLTEAPVSGSVKDVSPAVAGDAFFADKFFISRGSVQYSVELNEFDSAKQPSDPSLSPPDGNTINLGLSDLKVTQKLRPPTEFSTIDSVVSSGIVTTSGTVTATFDEDKTIADLKEIIENSGADATLKIDSETNVLSIIDDSQENLTLLATGENFTSRQQGNQTFVESLGLGNTNSKSLKTINSETKLDTLTDDEGNQLITEDRVNNILIIQEQAVDTSLNSVVGTTLVHTIELDGSIATSDLKNLDTKIADATKINDVPQFGLFFSNNNKRVAPGNNDENSTGVQIMKIVYDGEVPLDKGTSAASVIDSADEAVEEADGTVKRGKFAELMGLRNVFRDHTLVVEDKNFNVSQQTDLGQSIVSFQNIPIPPSENDTIKTNGAHDTLFSMYEGGTLTTAARSSQRGRGKVYESRERFFDFVPGFYRSVNEPNKGNPYYEQVRAEDRYSVLDERTWPIVLDFVTSSGTWKLVTPSWQPRKAGNLTNNPGPSPFISADVNEREGRQITAITAWRNRLWFAVDDTIFSSEFSNFFNLFLTDPGTITDIDVIDVRSSVDKVSKINNIIPFYDFLFVNTDNDIQFELQGSENQITPFTAELSPTTFYSSDPIAKPQLLGSQIYFFAPQKIYLYYSTANQSNVTQAIETTQHAEGYLPVNFGSITRAPAQDTIIMVDDDKKNELYLYTQRFAGDKVAQNSLSRYIFDTELSTLATEVFDNFLYMVTSRPFEKKSGSIKDYYFVERTFLESMDNDTPRLDRLHFFEPDLKFPADSDTVFNIEYDSNTNQTTFILPYQDAKADTLVFGSGYGDLTNRSIKCINTTTAGGKTRLRVTGKFDDIIGVTDDQGLVTQSAEAVESQGSINQVAETTEDQGELFAVASGGTKGIFVGVPYTMNVELSPQFVRSQDQTIVDGVLNLRTISTRYFNTGEYKIKVQRKGQEDRINITTKRNPFYKENIYNEAYLDSPVEVSGEGEFIAKVFGDSSHMRVFIESDHYTPCNITHIEFKGVFKQHYRSGQN